MCEEEKPWRKGAEEGGKEGKQVGSEDARNLFAFKLRSKLYIYNRCREGEGSLFQTVWYTLEERDFLEGQL